MKLGPCCLLLVAAVFSQTKPEDLCTAEGQVLNLATGAPVHKAEVVLHRAGQTNGSYSAVADSGGNFAINGIESGKYRLSASRTGFVATQYGARGPSRDGTTLSLQPGQRLKDLAVRLTPHAVITGRVVDEKREPIVLGQVQAMTYSFRAGKKELATSQMVHTNDLGEYRIYGLSPGKYYVTAALKNDRDEDEVDRSAVPRSNSYVTTYYPGVVDPAAAVLLEVGPGAQLGGINLTLAKARTFRVRGRVQGGQDITVNLVPRGQSQWKSLTTAVTAGPNGSFEIDQVLPGAYTLAATAEAGEKKYFARQEVDVAANDMDKVILTLEPGTELTGRIVVEGDAQPNVDAAEVRLREDNGGYLPQDVHNGVFAFSNVGPDAYTLQVANLPDGYWVKSIRMSDREVKDTGIDLAHGPAGPLTITLAPNAGQIDGVVLNGEQRPAPGATVVLVPEPRLRGRPDAYKTTTSDQNGRFLLKNIEPGDYKLFAWEDIESGAYMDSDLLRPVEDRGQSISIHEGSRESAQLGLIPEGALP
jgi:hypothetical protein